MKLQALIAEYRKISRRLRRRALLASARQVQSWKRRLAQLEQRIRLMGGRSMRRVALGASFAVAAGLLPQAAHAVTPVFQSSGLLKRIIPPLDPNGTDSCDYSHTAFGDIDGDGDLDAFTVSEIRGTSYSPAVNIRFFRNEGTATKPNFVAHFGAADNPLYSVVTNSSYKSINLVDLDGDGDLDLVLGDNVTYGYYPIFVTYGRVRYFRNEGTRTVPNFVEKTGSGNPFDGLLNEHSNALPVMVDLDGDGKIDMVASDGSNGLRFFRNTGTTTAAAFTEQTGTANPFNGMTVPDTSGDDWPAFGDLDGDGDLDVLIGGNDGDYVNLWENTGTKTHPAFVDRGYLQGVYNSYNEPSLADIDGDGDLDLFSGNERGEVDTWINKGDARHPKFSQPFNIQNTYGRMITGDVDGDGDADYIGPEVILQDNGGALQPADEGLFYGSRYSGPAFGDIDGDGDQDVLFADYAGSGPAFFRQDHAAGNFGLVRVTGAGDPSTALTGYSASQRTGFLADLDGDGDLDWVVGLSGSSSRIDYYRNDGTRTAPAFVQQSGPGNNPFDGIYLGSNEFPELTDFDNDGDQDLLIWNYSGHRYYRNDGTVNAPVFTPVYGADDPFYNIHWSGFLFFADFDHDGDTDVAVYQSNNNYGYGQDIEVWLNKTGRFQKVDPLAQSLDKIILGPVPQKQGDDVCLFVNGVTDTLDVDVYNIAGERVITGLKTAGGGATPCFKADMAPGLYWAKIKSGARTYMQKLIISAK